MLREHGALWMTVRCTVCSGIVFFIGDIIGLWQPLFPWLGGCGITRGWVNPSCEQHRRSIPAVLEQSPSRCLRAHEALLDLLPYPLFPSTLELTETEPSTPLLVRQKLASPTFLFLGLPYPLSTGCLSPGRESGEDISRCGPWCCPH